MKNLLKKKKGITLVSLVVTIIVLLILAGVTLNMVMGDSGIFSKANIASEKTTEGQKNEEQQFANIENKLNEYETITSRNSSNDYDVLWDWETKDENGNVTQTVKNSGSITLNNNIENYKYLVIFSMGYHDYWGFKSSNIVPSVTTSNNYEYVNSVFQWDNAGYTISYGFEKSNEISILYNQMRWITNCSITEIWGMK